jgi:hypothetical protein
MGRGSAYCVSPMGANWKDTAVITHVVHAYFSPHFLYKNDTLACFLKLSMRCYHLCCFLNLPCYVFNRPIESKSLFYNLTFYWKLNKSYENIHISWVNRYFSMFLFYIPLLIVDNKVTFKDHSKATYVLKLPDLNVGTTIWNIKFIKCCENNVIYFLISFLPRSWLLFSFILKLPFGKVQIQNNNNKEYIRLRSVTVY